ncbi:MAG TPA: FAD:protein FMN transferase [Gammaproteobacteria bacterium]
MKAATKTASDGFQRARDYTRARPMLGTLVEISAGGPDANHVAAAIAQAFRAVETVHRLMSYHDPHSDVSRINREAALRPVTVHAWTWRVLAAAEKISEASDGLFDITVAPVLAGLGYLPRHHGFPPVSGRGNWRHLELLPECRVRCTHPLHIDLGGIAKGFAVDMAIEILLACGMSHGRVNAGGDLRLFGTEMQTIHVRRPDSPTRLLPLIEIRQGAVATSAGYFAAKRVAGRHVSPHIHPHYRSAIAPDHSVTVLAEECIMADALTKAVLADPAKAGTLLAQFAACAFVMRDYPDTGAWHIASSGTGRPHPIDPQIK